MNLINNTVYFLQPFGPNQLVRAETKHSIWQCRLWTLRHSVHMCVCLGMRRCNSVDVRAMASAERRQVTNRCFHPRARDSVPISFGMIMGVREAVIVGCWSVKLLEENREMCRAREERWKNGGEAQLAAASNWVEQVSKADQTHMQCGSKEREGHKQSSRVGQAGDGGVRRAGGLEAGHTPAVTASL